MDSVFRRNTLKRINKKFKLLGSSVNMKPDTYLKSKLIISVTIFLLFLLFNKNGYIYGPLFSISFYILSDYYLDYLIKKRAMKLNYEAIFFFQILVLSLESGRDLKSAIKITTENIDSEISDEFKKCIKNMEIGKSLNECLLQMKESIPSDEINTVLLNIRQSNIFGNNILSSLNNQIDYLRDKKILDIKSKINKMPMKISVVSVVFIIPIIMLLLLGPVLINFLIK